MSSVRTEHYQKETKRQNKKKKKKKKKKEKKKEVLYQSLFVYFEDAKNI